MLIFSPLTVAGVAGCCCGGRERDDAIDVTPIGSGGRKGEARAEGDKREEEGGSGGRGARAAAAAARFFCSDVQQFSIWSFWWSKQVLFDQVGVFGLEGEGWRREGERGEVAATGYIIME